MQAVLRSVLSAFTAAVLLLAVGSDQCISCRTSVSASSRRGDCCTADGSCKTSSHKLPSGHCLKAHNSEAALVKQGVQVHSEITASTLEVAERVDPALNQIQASVPLTCDYSPPEPYLLNSVFLI
jgi:hypothetical protein